MKSCKLAAALFAVLFSGGASAAIIDNGTFTTDTGLGLDYLDVGLVTDTYSNFQAGIVYGARTWQLATASQIASTWSAATGLSLSSSDILSGDNNMTATATATLINLFDGLLGDVGSAGELVIGNYSQSGYYNFIDGGSLAVHSVFDDSHYGTDTTGRHGAWLVSAGSVNVPEPASLALLGLGLAGLGISRRKTKKK